MLLLVVEETDGAGLQSEGVKVRVGRELRGAHCSLFFEFCKISKFFCGTKKSVKKKQDTCEEKHGTAFLFFPFLLLLPAFVPHMSGGFGHMVALGGPPANQREGGWSPGSRRRI